MLPLIIPAAAAVGSAAIGATAQGLTNRQNIKFAREQLQTQRNWALSDWDKVNQYNSPMQQMERYKEAGLNPHLIYGSAQNSPSAMIRQTQQDAPKAEAGGYTSAANQLGVGAQQAMNAYFSQKSLENATNLTNAQVLKLKSETDRTKQQTDLTSQQFQNLVDKLEYETQGAFQQTKIKQQYAMNMPDKQMAWERYAAETLSKTQQGKLLLEQYELAKKNNLLTQADIDFLEKLGDSPKAVQMGFEFLKMINGDAMQAIPRKFKHTK